MFSHSITGRSEKCRLRLPIRKRHDRNSLRLRHKSKIVAISSPVSNDIAVSNDIVAERSLRVRPTKLVNKFHNSPPESDNDSSPDYISENDDVNSSNYASSDSDKDVSGDSDDDDDDDDEVNKEMKRQRKQLRDTWKTCRVAATREREERMSLVSALADCR